MTHFKTRTLPHLASFALLLVSMASPAFAGAENQELIQTLIQTSEMKTYLEESIKKQIAMNLRTPTLPGALDETLAAKKRLQSKYERVNNFQFKNLDLETLESAIARDYPEDQQLNRLRIAVQLTENPLYRRLVKYYDEMLEWEWSALSATLEGKDIESIDHSNLTAAQAQKIGLFKKSMVNKNLEERALRFMHHIRSLLDANPIFAKRFPQFKMGALQNDENFKIRFAQNYHELQKKFYLKNFTKTKESNGKIFQDQTELLELLRLSESPEYRIYQEIWQDLKKAVHQQIGTQPLESSVEDTDSDDEDNLDPTHLGNNSREGSVAPIRLLAEALMLAELLDVPVIIDLGNGQKIGISRTSNFLSSVLGRSDAESDRLISRVPNPSENAEHPETPESESPNSPGNSSSSDSESIGDQLSSSEDTD